MLTNGKSELFFIKRAESLLELKKPLSARRDCDIAIRLNPGASKAFRLRGRAFFQLGKPEEAIRDLDKAEQLNPTPEGTRELKKAQALLKETNKKNEKKQSSSTTEPRQRKTIQKSKSTSSSSSNIPSWLTPQLFQAVAQDPDMVRAFQNERIMTAITEIAKDARAFIKYQQDPEVLTAFMKFSRLISGTK